MQLKIYKSLWGMTGPLEAQFERTKAAGYDGIESATQEIQNAPLFQQLLRDHEFEYISLVYTEGPDHAEDFKRLANNALEFNPKKIVAHAGRDTMSYVKQVRFLESCLRIEEEIGIPIAHETHRRRPLFSPMNALAILRELPELRVNVDFSHWCVVTESLLEDHEQAIAIAAERSIHVHGRVGYENGPQVPDPRVPEWERCVTRHEAWWNLAIVAHRLRGEAELTFVPEYGPPSYMHTEPATGQPVANLWDVCLWSAERFRRQFEASGS
ncbi:MAG: TIM barrel protein [Bacteroidota bacterium]|nr:TIM barrel protein [Bacteroidota bacterium]MDP4232525.1 TIM barrel protein [Bacteroidota bacterium]MDP4241660.1 TIM barrel protein [Bacteroidota bacterium]MDP4286405.1 TIM barrel protein [Bacteroidota bacterium]